MNTKEKKIEISIVCSEEFAERMCAAVIDHVRQSGQISLVSALQQERLLTGKRRDDRLN